MQWLQSINRAIAFIEENLSENITVEDVAAHVYSSYSNFARTFYLITGVTIGEYIRNRRLSLAGRELFTTDQKIIDVAFKYQYDTPESFSKAFSRFHGITPSETKKRGKLLKFYYPESIDISVKGGYSMAHRLADKFYWRDEQTPAGSCLSGAQRYQEIIDWARKARGKNPQVFDELTGWLLDDEEWTEDRLTENRQILMQGILARFKEQNAQLRTYLLELRESGLVSGAVFRALDQFDEELSGVMKAPELREVVARMFSDFSVMRDRSVRRQIAGCESGPAGVNAVSFYGYINSLKECDAQVQWTLFMPDTVKRQQNGFKVERFEYVKAPAMRFIGREGEELSDPCTRAKVFEVLDLLDEYRAEEITGDVLFMHHHGLCVDVEPCHVVWGRFMQPGTPVPNGFWHVDLMEENDGRTGTPYLSQYACATFSGDLQAMHRTQGYDSDAMYDVTRNIILGQGVMIPYPHKYWTAEVFPQGWQNPSTVYLFSVDRDGQT